MTWHLLLTCGAWVAAYLGLCAVAMFVLCRVFHMADMYDRELGE